MKRIINPAGNMRTKLNLWRLGQTVLVLLLGACIPWFSGCGSKTKSAVPANVLAEVNGQPVTEKTFRYWWEEHRPGSDTPKGREAVLDELIERSAQVQAARKVGLDQDPVVLEQVEDLLIRRLQETRLFPRVKAVEVSAAEVESYYQSNLETKFTLPEQSRLAVLWFNTRGEAPLAARYKARLDKARSAVLNAPQSYPVQQGFGTLAIQNSEHQPSRYQGGDLGWLKASDQPGFRTTVERIGEQLKKPGEISPVTETADGIFVVRLVDRKPARTRELASVFDEIHRKLLHEKRQQVEEQFQTEITRAATVTRYAENLSAISDLPSARPLSMAANQPGRFEPPTVNASQPRE